ncbi:BMFP domain-containing protein YqiC [Wenyingzhuangia heitensis]|uniref:BMFP domain-containing protein YqiC n=1 Tax=Wenyingzhuangia heitensis TaxID=1487859 RepID=A0ABX0UBD8_9FLAO|nr:hypothetical protein [Wenyingzhuangia heitensis]NIJ46144.1 BMFP domain-containing protein YqiC [Wenyingzhuangia heitensis]
MADRKKLATYKFNKRRDSVFLLFVLGTFIFWFLNKLSNTYTQVVSYTIEYVDLPNQFVFQEKPQENLSFRIESDGFYFFSNAFKRNQIQISLAAIKKRDQYAYYLPNAELKKQVRSVIKEKINLLDVIEDTVEVKLGKKSFKKVPVVPNISINYHSGYNSFSGIKLIPDSIIVSGPEMQLAKVSKIKLAAFTKKDVITSIDEKIEIIKPEIQKIEFNKEQVELKIEVEKITEKTLMVAVQIINAPSDDVVLYPKKVKVTCQVRLSQFNVVKANDFTVICDYNNRGSKHIKIELVKKSGVVSSAKLNTNQVEYLILKE